MPWRLTTLADRPTRGGGTATASRASDSLASVSPASAFEDRATAIPHRHPGLVTRMLVTVVQTYQVVRANRPSPCRFTPSCSQYAVEALSRHGTRRGLRLTASRLGRCRPRGPFGADPVPE